MAVYRSGELFWIRRTAARGVLVVDGPGGRRAAAGLKDPSPRVVMSGILPTDICDTVDPQAHTHPVEVNS
jgi:hypothetical protein